MVVFQFFTNNQERMVARRRNLHFTFMETAPITCPSCFEIFHVAVPSKAEVPCDLDYDCEICCRPMVIQCWFDEAANEVIASAIGMDD